MKESNNTILSGYGAFFITVLVYLTALSILIISRGYHDSFLVLNKYNADWLDWPMFIITHLGDSMILASILSIILIWKRPDIVVLLIITVIVTGLTGQILKGVFFEGWDRPLRVFNESNIVHTLPHYRLFHNSFPSGHSITAMSLFTSLVLCLRPKILLQIVFALIAITVTYSRIYLGVHFPGDVLAGSLIGIVLTLQIMYLLQPRISKVTFSTNFRRIVAALSIILLSAGVYFLRVYYPLI